LALLGAQVGILSRNLERIGAAKKAIDDAGGTCLAFAADVRDYAATQDAADALATSFGKIDIVIAGAAGNFLAPASELSAKGFRAVLEIDLIGTFNLFKAAFEHLNTPGASLIAISAPQGSRPYAEQVHACSAKAGVNMLTKVLALEWAPLGIRVNAISPGPISDTEGVKRLWPDEKAKKKLINDVPMGSLGTKSDIADAVSFLCSASAKFVTGTILAVDGGYVWGSSWRSMGHSI
jgi:NAD(P)-dependent dehydrogenase (short-subunit alcohol dehydrogenase family)